jgi:hypothetical protein
MESNKKSARTLEDAKVNVKTQLSVLWVALLFFYLYNDVLSFFRRDTIEGALAGEMAGIQITEVFLFASSILMAIPIFMVYLSLALPAKVNRWTNIVVGIFHAVVLLVTLLVPGESWANYTLYMAFEALFIVLIVWRAWKWPRLEG